ncbi:UDP-2,4-diacetamido-2,4,6-trideoxy-beta-L-altropyranose hydrolase [compost metagenome]
MARILLLMAVGRVGDNLMLKIKKIIVFRADASLKIGSGHVMRCLTLADALAAEGFECHFICREHPGNLLDYISEKGYKTHVLSVQGKTVIDQALLTFTPQPSHSDWLGDSQRHDAEKCVKILKMLRPAWLIVDHYALDAEWEFVLKDFCRKVLVIDDLADRSHICDLLVDQNLGRSPEDYVGLVSSHCELLIGPLFSLLRSEFYKLRSYSLSRRKKFQMRKILIAMGGVDLPNATIKTLETLKKCNLPDDCEIVVVMGGYAPSLENTKALATTMPWPTKVLVDISDMAEQMATSDLAIGAAGGTSWERCCLGLPTIVVVLAENQWAGAYALQLTDSAVLLGDVDQIESGLPSAMGTILQSDRLEEVSQHASRIVDGLGVQRLIEKMRLQYA